MCRGEKSGAGAKEKGSKEKLHLIVDNSAMTEGVATSRAADAAEMGREIFRGLGEPITAPTFIGSDNKGNVAVASGDGAATRMKHCLRRYLSVLQRVERNVVQVAHVRGDDMPADYLTKMVSAQKLREPIFQAFKINSGEVAEADFTLTEGRKKAGLSA